MTEKVEELTVDELKRLIRETVRESLLELLSDPDAGLYLAPAVRERLQWSLNESWDENNTSTAKEVAQRLGLKW
jgi:hypothetical protein